MARDRRSLSFMDGDQGAGFPVQRCIPAFSASVSVRSPSCLRQFPRVARLGSLSNAGGRGRCGGPTWLCRGRLQRDPCRGAGLLVGLGGIGWLRAHESVGALLKSLLSRNLPSIAASAAVRRWSLVAGRFAANGADQMCGSPCPATPATSDSLSDSSPEIAVANTSWLPRRTSGFSRRNVLLSTPFPTWVQIRWAGIEYILGKFGM